MWVKLCKPIIFIDKLTYWLYMYICFMFSAVQGSAYKCNIQRLAMGSKENRGNKRVSISYIYIYISIHFYHLDPLQTFKWNSYAVHPLQSATSWSSQVKGCTSILDIAIIFWRLNEINRRLYKNYTLWVREIIFTGQVGMGRTYVIIYHKHCIYI